MAQDTHSSGQTLLRTPRLQRLRSRRDLERLREQAQHELAARRMTSAQIIVGMGTCGIAAGARETMQAISEELQERGIEAYVTQVGCIGMCSKEPLVDIQLPGEPRVTYANVHPEMIPHLIEEHLVHGRVVLEWAFGRVPAEGIGASDRLARE
jgi:NADP-reducing hydrogenase subunit HndB